MVIGDLVGGADRSVHRHVDADLRRHQDVRQNSRRKSDLGSHSSLQRHPTFLQCHSLAAASKRNDLCHSALSSTVGSGSQLFDPSGERNAAQISHQGWTWRHHSANQSSSLPGLHGGSSNCHFLRVVRVEQTHQDRSRFRDFVPGLRSHACQVCPLAHLPCSPVDPGVLLRSFCLEDQNQLPRRPMDHGRDHLDDAGLRRLDVALQFRSGSLPRRRHVIRHRRRRPDDPLHHFRAKNAHNFQRGKKEHRRLWENGGSHSAKRVPSFDAVRFYALQLAVSEKLCSKILSKLHLRTKRLSSERCCEVTCRIIVHQPIDE